MGRTDGIGYLWVRWSIEQLTLLIIRVHKSTVQCLCWFSQEKAPPCFFFIREVIWILQAINYISHQTYFQRGTNHISRRDALYFLPLDRESLNRLDWKDNEPDSPNDQLLTIYTYKTSGRCTCLISIFNQKRGNALIGHKRSEGLADRFPQCRMFAFPFQKFNDRNIQLL